MKIDVLDQQDLERTREVCQKLFHENYITEYVFAPNDALKQANEDYSFIMAHHQAVEELLDRCGWELCHDARAGVLYLNSHYTMAKMSLSQLESYILLGMRLLYDEKRTQASASGEVFVTAMEIVELLTAPYDLAGYKEAITEALYKGTKRNIESETDAKNVVVE